jgi:Ni/Fe-hydrogenase subunit HybB-like protein
MVNKAWILPFSMSLMMDIESGYLRYESIIYLLLFATICYLFETIFLYFSYIHIILRRRLALRFTRLKGKKEVARLTSPYRLKNYGRDREGERVVFALVSAIMGKVQLILHTHTKKT